MKTHDGHDHPNVGVMMRDVADATFAAASVLPDCPGCALAVTCVLVLSAARRRGWTAAELTAFLVEQDARWSAARGGAK